MTDLTKMWEALAAHQPVADRRGYGPAWAEMCDKKTEEAARNAAHRAAASEAARVTDSDAAYAAMCAAAAERAATRAAYNAADAAMCAGYAARAVAEADFAIKYITEATGEME
jgi:hypothetical protein